MKISHLIFLAFSLIIVLFSATTVMNFKQWERVQEHTEYVSNSGAVIRNSTRFQRNILNMVSGLRGYLLTGENYFLQVYDSAIIENTAILDELSHLIAADSPQQLRLKNIERLHDKWINEFATPLKNARATATQTNNGLAAFNQLYHEKLVAVDEEGIHKQLQAMFREFSNYEYDIRETRKAELAASVTRTRRISLILTIVSVLVGLAIVGFLILRIRKRIRTMVQMSNTIASGNYSIQIEDTNKDELSELVHSLNHMAQVLAENFSLLKRKNNELDQFAHIVSHDLKAPLRGIDNVISWIDEDHSEELPPKVKEYLQLIKGRVTRSENLIQGILSYARVDKEATIIEEVDVNKMIEEIKENMEIKPGIEVLTNGSLPVLHTELLPLMQVFSNLISNAIKYHNQPTGKIQIYCKDEGVRYRFFVKDDGPGIAQNHFQKIFIIFQTLQERDSFESTGVGLAIVKKILDARKETIQVSSELGKGAVFSFTWAKNQ
jgi:signal transduction histidine kinase